jgi:hypothetical protein
MRLVAFVLTILLGSYSFAAAQGNPSGRGSVRGDPAASSANPSAEPAPTVGSRSSTSGSGTSTSGGKDENMDAGRDKMPESNTAVKPSPGKPDIPSPSGRIEPRH